MPKITFEYETGRFSLLEALAYSRKQTVGELLKSLIDNAIHEFQEKNGVVNDRGSLVDRVVEKL
jgi:hypothetical protein